MFLQLFVDPVALLLIGVLSLVLYVSRKVVAVQSKGGDADESQASDSVSLGDHVGYSGQRNSRNISVSVSQ